jgi:hypothetical protein
MRSRSIRFWFWMFLFFAFPVEYAAAGQCVITMVSPVEGVAASPEFMIVTRITDGGYPFTEAGEKRWVEARLRDGRGQTIAALPLRDHGGGADRRRGDGEWTAPAILHLAEGNYQLFITVQRGGEKQSHAMTFRVSSKTGIGASTQTLNEASQELIASRMEALTKGMRRLEENLTQGGRLVGLYIICALILALGGIQVLLFLRQLRIQRSKSIREEQVTKAPEQDAPSPSGG